MDNYNTLIAFLNLVFVVVGGVFYWWLLCVVVAHAGGWARLAPKYRAAKRKTKSELLRWQSLRIGRCSYFRSASLHADSSGLYLAVGMFFRLSHPPLFIPWSAVLGMERLELGTGNAFELTVDAFPVAVGIQVPELLAERLNLPALVDTAIAE